MFEQQMCVCYCLYVKDKYVTSYVSLFKHKACRSSITHTKASSLPAAQMWRVLSDRLIDVQPNQPA